ncbi:hypothetical protein ABW19_dt0210162 [Dactylella cylindrospora]|nr:hypothetical protein ABW19_dt0210162 [Dactylella cylindrospora]
MYLPPPTPSPTPTSQSQSMSSYTTSLTAGALAEIILPVLATVGIFLRFHIRYINKISIKWDDYFILFSLPFSWALWAIWLYVTIDLVPYTVSTLPLENLTKFLLSLWIHDLCNVIAVMLIKISIMLFYLRAFATTQRSKWILYSIFLLNIIQFVMRIANILISCVPLKNTWENPWSCRADYLHALTLVVESFGLITEILLLVYPVPFVWRSHLAITKKLALCVVFFTGFVTCATQAVRIWVLERYLYEPSDFGRDVTAPTLVLCALFETSLGSFVVSVVAIWGPVREWVKGLWGRVRGKEVDAGGDGGGRRHGKKVSRNSDTLGVGTTTTGTTGTLVQDEGEEVGRMERVDEEKGVVGFSQERVVSERVGLMTPLPPDDDEQPWGRNVGGR